MGQPLGGEGPGDLGVEEHAPSLTRRPRLDVGERVDGDRRHEIGAGARDRDPEVERAELDALEAPPRPLDPAAELRRRFGASGLVSASSQAA